MPVYKLSEEPAFPYPGLARQDGLLAVGGDLSPDRLLLSYSNGIFPWYSEGDPILWWSPNPRTVIFPKDIKISKSMMKVLRKGHLRITFDTGFRRVITACGELRPEGTWISTDMLEAYCVLYSMGFAHSVEVWNEGRLVGGLYGVSLGRCFFGESMFSTMDNASKTALITLAKRLEEAGFLFIDCQMHTKHLESMGAVDISRERYLQLLKEGLEQDTLKEMWHDFIR